MLDTPLAYLLSIAGIAALFGLLERFRVIRIFEYLPAVVLIYLSAMVAANTGLWAKTEAIDSVYATAKNNLLPAMLFLMLLSVDLRRFIRLGRPLLIAYTGAFLSLGAAFVFVFWAMGFTTADAGVFATLCASWMGGTANMLAVSAALGVEESALGYALIVDSVGYTLWVILLLSLVPAAGLFNRFSRAPSFPAQEEPPGCACHVGARRYWLLILLSLMVAWTAQWAAGQLPGLGTTTWAVIIATLAGLAAAHLPRIPAAGSSAIASTMLLLLVALIGSRAVLGSIETVGLYLSAGLAILFLHGIAMVLLARLFRLDLFSIGIASLANIGGVASAPILAAAYERSLVGIAVLMAVMGYLAGTFGGLGVGYLLKQVVQ